jgi:glucose/arabinose dehydrogenase
VPFPPPAHAVTTLPPDFVLENVVTSGTFSAPIALTWLPDGRMLVGEKRGRIWAVKNGVKNATPMWVGDAEVLNSFDRGFLDVAVDPNYAQNRYVYLLYTVDPDTNNIDGNDDGFGRLTRYQVSATDSNVLDPSTRTILMGVDWTSGPLIASPSHTIGSLRWGRDGSLLVSTGDGAQFSQVDAGGLDSAAFGAGKTDPYEDIGSFRAQYLGCLPGKILRINPTNGQGYPSNPYWDGDPNSPRSKVWAYGFKNPFRFCVQPGTGSANPDDGDPGVVFMGDVGWDTWEDLNIVTAPGQNFGWPCYEGIGPQSGYMAATPAHHGCSTIGTPDNPAMHTPPVASWHHFGAALGTPPGFVGRTSVGGVFYTGTRYPAEWRNRYFHCDFGSHWIKQLVTDANYNLVEMKAFADTVDSPVDLKAEPGTGDLIFISIYSGEVHRVRYIGTVPNADPVAVAGATPTLGVAPLAVDFSSAGTYDPDADSLTLSWAFGDGNGSPAANPQHVYTAPGTWAAVLNADDGRGGFGRDTVIVTVLPGSGFPTTGVLDDFNRADGPLGGNWTGDVSGLQVSANRLVQASSPAGAGWDGAVFGPAQEAYVTLAEIDSAALELDLLLKAQDASCDSGCIDVRWDANAGEVSVHTFTPGSGWETRGGPFPLALEPGDQLGARATPDGTVQVFRSGVLSATASVEGWPPVALGGRVGLKLVSAGASSLDDFGGGDTVLDPNTPPSISITAPGDHSFYVAGDTIWMRCTVSDAEDPPAALAVHWEADLHHNTHIHPQSFLSDSATAFMIGADEDDGTGVWWRIRVAVTDSGGLADSASVDLFPEVDLEPSVVSTQPGTPGTTAPATWRFRLRNLGRLPAPYSRWRLIAGANLLAEGDTLVPALDSVTVAVTLPPALAPGTWDVRAVADTLAGVVETDETNNAATCRITVVEGPGVDNVAPSFLAGPVADPLDTLATIAWSTNEPTTGVVRFGLSTAFGESTAAALDTTHVVLLTGLAPGTRYYYQVSAADTAGFVTLAAADSFLTLGDVLAVPGASSRLALSSPFPNPSAGTVDLALDLPAAARVEFAVHDLLGREVWREPAREAAAGRLWLEWNGRTSAGARAAPGVYHARVTVNGVAWLRRIALIR